MSDYIAVIPTVPDFVPAPDDVRRAMEFLIERDIVRSDGPNFTTGAKTGDLIRDPKTVLVDGKPVLSAAVSRVVVESHPALRGHAGRNFEPIACRACSAELPFDEMLAALGAADGRHALTQAELTIVCFHCAAKNFGPEHDYGFSGGFARFEIRFEVSTTRQTIGDAVLLKELGAILGRPVKFVQVLE